jgi:hypothetical protein
MFPSRLLRGVGLYCEGCRNGVERFELEVEWAVDEDVRRVPDPSPSPVSMAASKVYPRRAVSTARLICFNVRRPRRRATGTWAASPVSFLPPGYTKQRSV